MKNNNELDQLLNYHLPPSKIAQRPASFIASRDSSKLLWAQYHKGQLALRDKIFSNVVEILQPGDVLVLNNSKVINARFFFELREGTKAEILLVRPLDEDGSWECIGKPLRKLDGQKDIKISKRIRADFLERINGGRGIKIRLKSEDLIPLSELIHQEGYAPIPPYIREGLSDECDKELYQTVFALEEGSVAAPTAGLHFTKEILEELEAKGIKIFYITLHVGPYSFFSVKEGGEVLTEKFKVTGDDVLALEELKERGARIIAVGTTVVRCLESLSHSDDQRIKSLKGEWCETSLMIQPGFKFKLVDSMFTNFHQPNSTHLLLVAAFLGIDNMLEVYKHALKYDYRFLSYGDSSFLERF